MARTFRFLRFRAAPILGLGLALLGTVGDASAQESPPSEYRLKAAFLFNFAKFVEWPPEAFADKSSPFVIGILGANPFGADLEQTIREKSVNDHPLRTREIRTLTEATNCHILFVSLSEKSRLVEIFESLRGSCVLTVGETEQFTKSGGMINFVLQGNKIRFEINDDTARRARLKINSKLLSLALTPSR